VCSRRFSHSSEIRLLASSYPPVRLSTRIGAAPTGRIYVKFGTGYFYEDLRRKSKFAENQAKLSDTLH